MGIHVVLGKKLILKTMKKLRQMFGALLVAFALDIIISGIIACNPHEDHTLFELLIEGGKVIGTIYIVIVLLWAGIDLLDSN